MVEETRSIGLSREFIIHPGESLAEAIEDRDMSQHELAVRTGMTEKHISTVIHGQKNISSAFAKKLEYALGIKASFWMNLQANYDQELLAFEELNNISDTEISILKNLKEVTEKWILLGFLQADENPASLVLDYRKALGISNLGDIPLLSYSAAFRAQSNSNVDPYVLFAWQKMCEYMTDSICVADRVDIVKLKKLIPEIKKTMFMKASLIQDRLTDIFSDCGIAFSIVPNFRGAPVQGFVKNRDNGPLILCLTLRRNFADIFWFTLFHEIAHIINGDTKHVFIDFDSVSSKMESKANELAGEWLINPIDYRMFIDSKGYEKSIEIQRFADSQNVKDFIVLGRLMKDNIIPWSARTSYKWV